MMKSVMAALGVLLLSGAASAQQASQGPGRPEVKRVEDWFVRCFQIESPSPCDMYQELDNRETRQRILSLSIAFVPSLDRHALQITVPLDIAIPKGLVIQTDSYKSPVLKYRRCDRNGCYVEVAVENAVIESLARSSGDGGKIVIAADSGKVYNLNFSLKGFATAHDDMVTKAKAKAKAPAAPAAAANP